MGYTLLFSPVALADIDKVWDDVYLASKNYDLADRYVESLMDKIAGKKEFPTSGTPVFYGDFFTGYYRLTYKAYTVFYRIKDEYVEISRVLMSKSDYMSILFG